MKRKPDGGPAFPAGTDKMCDEDGFMLGLGMSLRDYFAGQALANMICQPVEDDGFHDVADNAYRLADAMIAARDAG